MLSFVVYDRQIACNTVVIWPLTTRLYADAAVVVVIVVVASLLLGTLTRSFAVSFIQLLVASEQPFNVQRSTHNYTHRIVDLSSSYYGLVMSSYSSQ